MCSTVCPCDPSGSDSIVALGEATLRANWGRALLSDMSSAEKRS